MRYYYYYYYIYIYIYIYIYKLGRTNVTGSLELWENEFGGTQCWAIASFHIFWYRC